LVYIIVEQESKKSEKTQPAQKPESNRTQALFLQAHFFTRVFLARPDTARMGRPKMCWASPKHVGRAVLTSLLATDMK
jgi:hypothetical protein